MARRIALGSWLALVVGVVGCETHRGQLLPKQPRVEEFNVPPDDPKYSEPPQSGYVKPKKIVDNASKMGQDAVGTGPSNIPGGANGPGMGGMGGGMR